MSGAIVLTSSEGSFPGLAEALRGRGLEVLERPLIRFAEPDDWRPLDTALKRASSYQAIALTSPRAGESVVARVRACGIAWPPLPSPALWASGPTTAAPVERSLGPVRLPGKVSPELGAAAVLAEAMLEAGVAGPVLFPCGATRRDELPTLLERSGVRVDSVVCYQTVLADADEARVLARSAAAVVVASPSVVNLLVRAGSAGERPLLVAVGPTTAAAASSAGWAPAVIADEPTSTGVLNAISTLQARR
jgi:uroporphyrinogen-III synthase